MKRLFTKSIAINLAASLIIIFIIVLGSLFTLEYYRNARIMLLQLKETTRQYADNMAEILVLPIWAFDTPNIARIGDAFIQIDIIDEIIVSLPDGGKMLHLPSNQEVPQTDEDAPPRNGKQNKHLQNNHINSTNNDRIYEQRNVYYNETHIGTIGLFVTLDHHQKNLTRILSIFIINIMVSVIILAFTTGVLLNFMLKKPLAEMQAGMLKLAKGDPVPAVESSTETGFIELAAIFKTFNAMVLQVRDREKALISSEGQLKQSLNDKEIMLREIHHRVKNNFQVISSLLNLQSTRVENEHARAALTESCNRIRSMALIHEKLYQADSFSHVNFQDYLDSITGELMQTNKLGDLKVYFEIDIDPVTIPLDTAVPLGLILNELISNSLKHAFSGRSKGTIKINTHCTTVTAHTKHSAVRTTEKASETDSAPAAKSPSSSVVSGPWSIKGTRKKSDHAKLYTDREAEKQPQQQQQTICLLTFSDDGIGLPVDFHDKSKTSLGFTLIRALAGQLPGTVYVVNSMNNGDDNTTLEPATLPRIGPPQSEFTPDTPAQDYLPGARFLIKLVMKPA